MCERVYQKLSSMKAAKVLPFSESSPLLTGMFSAPDGGRDAERRGEGCSVLLHCYLSDRGGVRRPIPKICSFLFKFGRTSARNWTVTVTGHIYCIVR